MKVLKTWLYWERIIYLVQIDNKYTLFYRSSGLAGYDSKGTILPCYLLKTDKSSIGDPGGYMVHGWIPKVYLYNGEWESYHSKDIAAFPKEIQQLSNELQHVDVSAATECKNPKEINEAINEIIGDGEFFDWARDNLVGEYYE